jgi:hypothetical protein
METTLIATHYPINFQGPPANVSLTVPNRQPLDFIYYAIATERFGETIIHYEYEMEEGAEGNFMIILPRPPGPLHQWIVMVCGYRDGEKVLNWEKNAMQIFY